MSHFTRRTLLKSVPALAAASRVMGQAGKPQIQVHTLSHATLTVTDPKRSTDFYQGLFGMGIQAKQGTAPSLQIGAGPEFIFISGGANSKPGINHYCMTMKGYTPDGVGKILEAHGITKAEGAGGGMTGGTMKYKVRIRSEAQGGAKEGTPEFYFGDPDGIAVQIQDDTYCGGAGSLGEICKVPAEPAPGKGLLQVKDLSHFTLFVADAAKSLAFYQDVFAMPITAHQGATPLLGVGNRGQFLTIAGGGANRPPEINHLCMRMENFNTERVFKALSDFGLKPREAGATGPVAPLRYYVTMRMPNRGGAKDGTAELYFTDPDGILIQLQDMSYCGGAGVMGEVCTG